VIVKKIQTKKIFKTIIIDIFVICVGMTIYQTSQIPSEKTITNFYKDNRILFEDIKDQFMKYYEIDINNDHGYSSNFSNQFFINYKDNSFYSEYSRILYYTNTNSTFKNNLIKYFENTPLDYSTITWEKTNNQITILFRATYSKFLPNFLLWNNYFQLGIIYDYSKTSGY